MGAFFVENGAKAWWTPVGSKDGRKPGRQVRKCEDLPRRKGILLMNT